MQNVIRTQSRWIALVLSLLLLGPAVRAGHGDHLEVPDSVLSMYDFAVDYEYAVRKVLLADREVSIPAGLVCTPSLSLEWALLIHEPGPDLGKVEYIVAESPIWTAEDRLSVSANARSAELPAALAKRVADAWEQMLRGVRPASAHDGVRLDGATYHFWGWGIDGGGIVAGSIWSPPRKSPAGQLVKLAYALREYVLASDEERKKSLSEINKSLDGLSESLKAN